MRQSGGLSPARAGPGRTLIFSPSGRKWKQVPPLRPKMNPYSRYGEKDDIAEIDIREEDLKEIPVMDARVNEQIKAQFEKREEVGSISDYLI